MKLNFYPEMTTVEKRTFWASLAGYTFDSFDTTIYALVAPVLITFMGFTRPEIGALTTAALFANSIGGWTAGIIADRFGRKFALNLTILWVTVFSGLAALTTNYHQFMAVRFLQGFGVGGEAAVCGVLISEAVRTHLRGRVVSAVQSGYAIGYALSTAMMPVIFHYFPENIAWRAMFVAGFVPALLIFYVWRFVPESESFTAIAAARKLGAKAEPFWKIFDSENLWSTIRGLFLCIGVLGAGFAIHAWLPTYLRLSLHLNVTKTAGYLALSITGLFLGPLCAGRIADYIGRRFTILAFLGCEAFVIIAFLFLPINLEWAIGLIFLQGILQGGAAACLVPTITELYRAELRGNGLGFCNTGARGFGSIATTIVGVLATIMPLGHAMGICTLGAFGIAIIAALILPDRSRVDFKVIDTEKTA